MSYVIPIYATSVHKVHYQSETFYHRTFYVDGDILMTAVLPNGPYLLLVINRHTLCMYLAPDFIRRGAGCYVH